MTDLSIHSGDDRVLEIAVVDSEGVPVGITGATLDFMAKWKRTDPDADAVLTKATGGNGIDITDGPGGLAEVTISSADTADLAGAFHWELQVLSAGLRRTVAYGGLRIRPDVVGA